MRTLPLFLFVGSLAFSGCGGSGTKTGDTEWPPNATVYFDEYGIFHGDCETDEDCAMALGYFHARDRFFQMDLQRRLSTGRLTSIVNKTLIEGLGLLDGLINTASRNRALYSTRQGQPAEDFLIENADEDLLRVLEAYSAGVNQWIDDAVNERNDAQWPVEYGAIALDYGPEDTIPWEPSDTYATFFTLVGNLTIDEGAQLSAASAREAIGDNDRFLDLYSLEPIKKSPILEVGTYPFAMMSLPKEERLASTDLAYRARGAIAKLQKELADNEALSRLFPEMPLVNSDIGSNNWVLGPSKTENGNTFLSNDPHLGLSQPPVWYIAHWDSKTNGKGTIHSAGVTLAGIPGAVIGQNENIAWGATNTGLDFTDVYMEELVLDEEDEPIGVMFNGEVVEFTRVDFVMDFNDGSTETRELLFVPHHGPVRTLDVDNNICLTLRWTGNDMDTDPNFLLPMQVAETVEDAREALTNITSIGQNWVVIDNEGNFGWFPYNRIPKRTWAVDLDLDDPEEPFPWLPLPGTGEYEWDEYFDYPELPQTFNRDNGWLATANSDHTGAAFDGNPTNDGFAPQQTDNIAAGYRTARIVELIEATDDHTRQTNEDLISDIESLIGRDMIPEILAIADEAELTDDAQKVVDALTAWQATGTFTCPTGLDGNDPVDSPLASADEVAESTGCSAWHEAIAQIDRAVADDEPNTGFPSFVTYFSIMDPSRLKAGDVYWDDVNTKDVETKAEIIGAALDAAGSTLVDRYGSDDEWPWGRYHGMRLTSLLASLSSLFNDYNNPPGVEEFFSNDGGLYTVDVANPGSSGLHGGGPSTRFQCEGSKPVACTIQLPGGQSAHPTSDNYDSLLPLWLDNEPIELIFDIDEAAEVAVETFEFSE